MPPPFKRAHFTPNTANRPFEGPNDRFQKRPFNPHKPPMNRPFVHNQRPFNPAARRPNTRPFNTEHRPRVFNKFPSQNGSNRPSFGNQTMQYQPMQQPPIMNQPMQQQQFEPVATANSIRVENLPLDVDEKDLVTLFDDCGAIVSITIPQDSFTSAPIGIANIIFASEDCVEKATKKKKLTLRGNVLKVTQSAKKKQPVETKNYTTVRIDNIPQYTESKTLYRSFINCGKIIDISFRFDARKNSKFVLIAFDTAQAADNAMKLEPFLSRKQMSITKDRFDPRNQVVLRNLPTDTNIMAVKDVLKDCGTIVNYKLLLQPKPPPTTSLCFIVFACAKSAKKAIELKSVIINNAEITIEPTTFNLPVTKNDDDDDEEEEEDQNGELHDSDMEENKEEKMDQDDDDDDDDDDNDDDDDDDDEDDDDSDEAAKKMQLKIKQIMQQVSDDDDDDDSEDSEDLNLLTRLNHSNSKQKKVAVNIKQVSADDDDDSDDDDDESD